MKNMAQLIKTILRYNKLTIASIIFVAIAVVAVFLLITYLFRSSSLHVEKDDKINNTAVTVESMRQIGEWEFLNISNEELVDTTRKRLFSDDELVRIYYGVLRLGIDMRKMTDKSIVMKGDSVIITLPEITLLDDNFIDEARTKSFYETGNWDGKAHEALYNKAKRLMKQRCLTEENKHKARENAICQVGKMVMSLGAKNVRVK